MKLAGELHLLSAWNEFGFQAYMRWFAMASVRGFLAFGEKRVFLQGGLCGFSLK